MILSFLLLLGALHGADLSRVEVATSKTSIYVGSVTLELGTLTREGDRFVGSYRAKVFPYFFMGEHGTFSIVCDAAQVAAILRGERVPIQGEGRSSGGELRKVNGYAQASAPDVPSGKIKVKIFVSKNIELIFNSTFQFP